jgi:DNA-binding beta-propeller fold protein YncE
MIEKLFELQNFNVTILSTLAWLPIAWLVSSEPLHAHTVTIDYEVKPIPLLSGSDTIILDHLAYDPSKDRLWVPASNTGKVVVIDGSSDTRSSVSGFSTGEVELEGHKVQLGPTSASIGEGVVYVGNRGDSTLCVIDSQTLARADCAPISRSSPEGDTGPHQVVYVALTREVWVTKGPGKSIQIFDASDAHHPKFKTKIELEGGTEGAAIDNKRGRFYTNIAERGSTISIDVRSHKLVSQWDVGSKDLQGLAIDTQRGFLFVACADHVVSLDIAHGGRPLDFIPTGAGLDDIDFSPEQKFLYAAAGITATLSVIEVSNEGKFHLKSLVPTAKAARGVKVGRAQTAYVIDPAQGRILKVTHKSHDETTTN